jgi:hypothetical protein
VSVGDRMLAFFSHIGQFLSPKQWPIPHLITIRQSHTNPTQSKRSYLTIHMDHDMPSIHDFDTNLKDLIIIRGIELLLLPLIFDRTCSHFTLTSQLYGHGNWTHTQYARSRCPSIPFFWASSLWKAKEK